MKKQNKEIKYYGIHACLELWKKRPDDIIRVYLTKNNVSIFSFVLKWCAKNKKSYHLVEEEDLCKITESTHHEGVCVLAFEKQSLPFQKISAKENCLLYLDGISNPHNIGSIIRTCTHFGINHIIGQKNKLPALTPSACRIAKGGAEHVSISYLDSLNHLKSLKEKGFTFIATDSNSKKAISLYKYSFPAKSLIILGAEDKGISKELMKEADTILLIPGTNKIESLNVSVASALFLGEYWRQKECKSE
jgi:RNA methyltransferase, TrmH family